MAVPDVRIPPALSTNRCGMAQQVHTCRTSGSGSEEKDTLRHQWFGDDLQCRGQTSKDDTGSALDVIVVAEHLVRVAVQEADRVGPLPILEMNAAVRKELLHRPDEFLGQFIEFLIGGRRLPHSEIKRGGPPHTVSAPML